MNWLFFDELVSHQAIQIFIEWKCLGSKIGRRSKESLKKETEKEIGEIFAEYAEQLSELEGCGISAALYARFSSEMQNSIAAQIRSLVIDAIRRGIHVSRKNVFYDIAVRGSKRQREGLDAAISAIRDTGTKVLMVFKTNRLYRKMYRALAFVDRLIKSWNARIIFTKNNLDSDAEDYEDLKLQLLAMLDEHGRRAHVDNVQSKHLDMFARMLVHGTVTFGYAGEPIEGELTKLARPRRRYVLDEHESEYVLQIFKWFVEDGLSIAGIVQVLNDTDAPLPPKAEREWTRQAVIHLLKNERYIGVFKYGKQESVDPPDADYILRRDRDEPLGVKMVEELRIIPDSLFFEAQKLLKENKSLNFGSRARLMTANDRTFSTFTDPRAFYGNFWSIPSGYVSIHGMNFYHKLPNEKVYKMPPLRLNRASIVKGSVVDEHGVAVAGASVLAKWETSSLDGGIFESQDFARTDKLGKFELTKVPSKITLNVFATSDGAKTENSLRVHAEDDEILKLVVSRKHSFNLRGRVVDSVGEPIREGKVEIWGHSDRSSSVIFHEGARFFEIKDGKILVPRYLDRTLKYSFNISVPGFQKLHLKKTTAPRKGDWDLGRLKLKSIRSVHGQVVDSANNPIANATVWGLSEDTSRLQIHRAKTKTNELGEFHLESISPDARMFYIDAKGYRFVAKRVEPSKGLLVKLTKLDPSEGRQIDSQITMSKNGFPNIRLMVRQERLLQFCKPILAATKSKSSDSWIGYALRTMANAEMEISDEHLRQLKTPEAQMQVLLAITAVDEAIQISRSANSRYAFPYLIRAARNGKFSKSDRNKMLVEANALLNKSTDPNEKILRAAMIANTYWKIGDNKLAKRLIEKHLSDAQSNHISKIAALHSVPAVAPLDIKTALKIQDKIASEQTRFIAIEQAAITTARVDFTKFQELMDSQNDYQMWHINNSAFHIAENDHDGLLNLLKKYAVESKPSQLCECYADIASAIYQKQPDTAKTLVRKGFQILSAPRVSNPESSAFALLNAAALADHENIEGHVWRTISIVESAYPTMLSSQGPYRAQAKHAMAAMMLGLYGIAPDERRELIEPIFKSWESMTDIDKVDFRFANEAIIAMTICDAERAMKLFSKWWFGSNEEYKGAIEAPWKIAIQLIGADSQRRAKLIEFFLFRRPLPEHLFRNEFLE